MKRVTGIGGIFFKAADPDKLREWYRRHLGFELEPWGGMVFKWNDSPTPDGGVTIWSLMPDSNDTFAPSSARFMVNYRVDDLDAVLQLLRDEGCQVDARTEESELGKFGWVMDPEGNRVELWQPPKAP
ncbi:VOC family protein [Aquincola sp. S2]|uniref:VOC family protein n=1 Tax=Pseudaquabacterium terrae TaxID=2732868 RepID=A0ABX2EUP5_9BURK|nr:VOC family protein [Aquabacterium terrae]NRF72144.1 VOC family protein [Aquabacterium terrae]